MRSKLHIKGHPVHAMLVPFPVAFFTATPVFDVLGWWKHDFVLEQTAVYCEMAGVLTALAAAVAGVIDYFATVPPNSSARTRATWHGLLNVTSVLVFGMALLLRKKEELQIEYVVMLELAGAVMTTIAGWMGGTLLVRNQIGVDHRYADAGKWSEQYINTSGARIELKDTEKLKLNQMRLLVVNGKRYVIGRTEQGLVAFDDFCTHRGGSLADGALICGTVQCPWHGSQFDVATGQLKAGPAKENIRTYPVTLINNSVFVDIV